VLLDNEIKFEKLDPKFHDRAGFNCGENELDIFLKLYANQQQSQGFNVTYVCVQQNDPNAILGYYTLSPSSLNALDATYFSRKRIPYQKVGTIKIGRLARDKNKTPNGFGKFILKHALNQCLVEADIIGCFAGEVDIINEGVKGFYEKFGFQEIPGLPQCLILPISTIKQSQATKTVKEAAPVI